MKSIFYTYFILFSALAYGQENRGLPNYLAHNRYSLNISKDSGLDIMDASLKNKQLFVLGEGGSHYLNLYNDLRVLLSHHLSNKKLKYFFIEGGRSVAYTQNKYLLNRYGYADGVSYRRDTLYSLQMKKIRDVYENGSPFLYIGIDMEWGSRFYKAVKDIAVNIDSLSIQNSPLLSAILIDTGYLQYSNTVKGAWANQQLFLDHYYKVFTRYFLEDSNSLKKVLGAGFNTFKYFLTNPQINGPQQNRNDLMAKNLLAEIRPLDTSVKYLLDVGMAHSLPNAKGSLVNILSKSETLKDRIIVMNTYCDSCTTSYEPVLNYELKFMNGQLLEDFRNAAQTDLTLFDLSKLPKEYDYIKAYGDFLLFAKNKN